MKKALANPQVRDRVIEHGAESVGGAPVEFGRLIRNEIPRWAGIIEKAGVQPT